MADENKERYAENPRLLWLAEASRALLGFVVLGMLARHASSEALGRYLALTALLLVVPRVLDLGLPIAMSYLLRIDPTGLRAASSLLARHLALAVPIAAGVAFALRYFPFANQGVTDLTIERWPTLTLLILSELAILLSLAAFVPTGRFKAYLATTLVSPCALVMCLVLWPFAPPDAGRLLTLLQCASLLGALTAAGALARAGRADTHSVFSGASAYRYGLRSYGSGIAKVTAQRFDRLFLATVLGATGYAQYSLAVSIRDIAVFPANLHAMTTRNAQIDLLARRGDLAGGRAILLRTSLSWLGIGVLVAAAMYPLWPAVVVAAFGRTFAPTADFLEVLAFSGGPLATMGFALNHLYALNLPGRVTLLSLASLLLAVPIFMVSIRYNSPSVGVAVGAVIWAYASSIMSTAWAMGSRPPVVAAKARV